ncbi:MAG: hypothetical protein NZ920_00715 [Aigarchaeota archaeon]|nr:hypothetical protein [Aigarchaeota archaeon]MDW8092964.1 hypothetical protein [Nitrososphaerota archaeon]
MPYCLDCGGLMIYDRDSRGYVCQSCGSSMNINEYVERKETLRIEKERMEREKRRKDEYLEWWLSSKK